MKYYQLDLFPQDKNENSHAMQTWHIRSGIQLEVILKGKDTFIILKRKENERHFWHIFLKDCNFSEYDNFYKLFNEMWPNI